MFCNWSQVGLGSLCESRGDRCDVRVATPRHPTCTAHSGCPLSTGFMRTRHVQDFSKTRGKYRVSTWCLRLNKWRCSPTKECFPMQPELALNVGRSQRHSKKNEQPRSPIICLPTYVTFSCWPTTHSKEDVRRKEKIVPFTLSPLSVSWRLVLVERAHTEWNKESCVSWLHHFHSSGKNNVWGTKHKYCSFCHSAYELSALIFAF